MRVLYFGCVGTPGHYLHEGNTILWRNAGTPWEPEQLDMTLCPGVVKTSYGHKCEHQTEGAAAIHHRDGWTAIAFWDRSVDTRKNCNSVFIVEGIHEFDDAKRHAMASYPKIWKRFRFEVLLSRGEDGKGE